MNARKTVYIGGAALAILGSHFIQPHLNEARRALGLTRNEPLENAPPVLAFTTVALGGFRGIIVNALWIRSNELQDDGRYFEAVQLADWITKLQPHFASVWVNLAWNMSYNISVKFPDPEDRWNWVQRGIELLRDEGLKYNPHSVDIYAELARHFQHKMGAYLDDAHLVYKYHWYREMEAILPGGRPNYAELLAPTSPEATERVRSLREKYKMDPAAMQAVDQTYGPLEWRLPETHAIYWASQGLKEGNGEGDKRMLRRNIFQPMQTAFQRGRLVENRLYIGRTNVPAGLRFMSAPNLEMIPNSHRAYLAQRLADPEMAEHFGTAHRNFQKDAVYFLFSYGREKEAAQWFDYIKKNFEITGIPPNQTVEDYCVSRIGEDINETSPDRIKAMIQGPITTAFTELVAGDLDRAQSLLKMAGTIHRHFETRTSLNAGQKGRTQMPSFEEMKIQVARDLLAPDENVNPAFQAGLRTALKLPANFGIPTTNAPARSDP